MIENEVLAIDTSWHGEFLVLLNDARSFFEENWHQDICNEFSAIISSFPDTDLENAVDWLGVYIEALGNKGFNAQAANARKKLDALLLRI